MISHVIHGCSNVLQPANAFRNDSCVMETMIVVIDPMKQMPYAVRYFTYSLLIAVKIIETQIGLLTIILIIIILFIKEHGGHKISQLIFTFKDFLSNFNISK